MSNSNRTRITYIEETNYGITPGSPDMVQLRITGESISKDIETIKSTEIIPDRQVSDTIQTSRQVSGDINFELSFATFDPFFESALFDDFTTPVNMSASTIAATASGFTDSGNGFVSAGIYPGMWIKTGGFTNAGNNTFFRVLTVVAGTITTSPAPAAIQAAGTARTIKGSGLINGVDQKSFTIEKGFLSSAEYFKYVGMMVSQMSLELSAQQILSGSFSFMGKEGTLSGTSLDEPPVAPNSNPIFNAVGNVASIREGGSAVATPNFVNSLSLTVNNNLRQKFAIGSDSSTGIGDGTFDVEGSVSTYFGNSALMDKFLGNTETSIDFLLTDSAGNSYIFDLPRVKFESGQVVAGAENQDVMAEMGFRALKHSTYGFTMQICKFPV